MADLFINKNEPINLISETFLTQLKEEVSDLVKTENALEAKRWYTEIIILWEKAGYSEPPTGILKTLLGQLHFFSLPWVEEDEANEMIRRDLAFACQIPGEFDPWAIIRTRLSLVPSPERNIHKSNWLKIVHENGEMLTSSPIMVSGASVSPTVMNWIKDYDLFVGGIGPADGLKKTQFVFRGKNILATPAAERGVVKKLIDIYEKLKLDSLELSGIEQSPMLLGDDDRFKQIIDGIVIDLDSGLPETEYRATLQPQAPFKELKPSPKVATSAVRPTIKNKPLISASVPEPAPKKVVAPSVTPSVTPPPATPTKKPAVVSARVAEPARMTEVDMQSLPPTIIKRPSPAASSPQQTPKLTGNLPTGSAQPTSGALIFSDEDEKEVANIKQAQKIFFKAPEGIDYDYVSKKVMGVHKLFFPSYDLERRFSNLVTSYMKGVRDQMEFKDLMTRPENSGGLNLSGDITDKILLTMSEEAALAPQAKARVFGKAVKSQLTPSMGQVKKAMDQTKASEGTVTPTGEMVQAPTRAASVRVTGTASPRTAQGVRAPLDARKPLMTDIKGPPKVMGPVDELANLSVVEFRRLGGTPQAATEKIKAKIDILEAESLLKQSEGIRAWQNSPVNQLYLILGQEALNTGRQVEDVVQQRTLSQQPVLTKQEFDAIADLNKRLRY